MTRKKELYIIIAVFISLSLVFGSIQNNFSAESNKPYNISNATGNNSFNNSTVQNATLLINNSTVASQITVKNQSTINTIPYAINTTLNLFTAVLVPTNGTTIQEVGAAAGNSKFNSAGTISQTGPLSPIKSRLTLNQCLKQTANAQSKNSTIKALAKKITKGATSKYAKAVKIFNWVRDNIGYSFYYNTKYGAVKTLKKRSGNCVDTSHLLVALLRASGIPARYVHVKAKFPDGEYYGHVFVQAYVRGKWYNADASSIMNSFGVIRKWDKGTAKIKGVYASLPF